MSYLKSKFATGSGSDSTATHYKGVWTGSGGVNVVVGPYDFNDGVFPSAFTRNDATQVTVAGGLLQLRGPDNCNNYAELVVTVPTGGTWEVRFNDQISSENNWDFGRFFVDGVQQFAISGASSNSRAVTLTAGAHTLRWAYNKDGGGSQGADTYWVDNIRVVDMSAPVYAVNDVVKYNGGVWLALASNQNTTPVEGATWTAISSATAVDPTAAHFKGAWSSSTSYAAGDVTSYAGRAWAANQNINVVSPAFRTSLSGTGTSGQTFSFTVPAAVQVGDLMFIAVSQYSGNAAIAPPSGWTRVGPASAGEGLGTNGVFLNLFKKIAVAGDLGSTVATVGIGDNWHALFRAYSGVSGVDAVGTYTSPSNQGSALVPQANATFSGDLAVVFAAIEGSSVQSTPTLTGATVANAQLAASVNVNNIAAADIAVSGAGLTTNTLTLTPTSTTALSIMTVTLLPSSVSPFPTSKWDALGSPVVQSKTAAYSMVESDTVVLANGTFTVTLPPISSVATGVRYTIKNVGTGVITIAPASGTIDGAASFDLTVRYSSLDVATDGTNWYTV